MAMMRVEFKKPWKHFTVGKIVELQPNQARLMIQRGICCVASTDEAEAVVAPPKKRGRPRKTA